MRSLCSLPPGCPQNHPGSDTNQLEGCMEEAASRHPEEEAWRQPINNPCSSAFHELGLKGVWLLGSMIWLQPRPGRQAHVCGVWLVSGGLLPLCPQLHVLSLLPFSPIPAVVLRLPVSPLPTPP